jgi:hypothetical protein
MLGRPSDFDDLNPRPLSCGTLAARLPIDKLESHAGRIMTARQSIYAMLGKDPGGQRMKSGQPRYE